MFFGERLHNGDTRLLQKITSELFCSTSADLLISFIMAAAKAVSKGSWFFPCLCSFEFIATCSAEFRPDDVAECQELEAGGKVDRDVL